MTDRPTIGSALGLTVEQAIGDGARVDALRRLRAGVRTELHRAIDGMTAGEAPVDVAIRLRAAMDRMLRNEWGS